MSLVTLANNSCQLTSATAMPDAAGFLWNEKMLLNVNCRGYFTSTFMQPEPAKYSRGPNIEATTFIQPEHPYFSHHPGRFFYIKDEDTGELFSAPFEPVRKQNAQFEVNYEHDAVNWRIVFNDVQIELRVFLAEKTVAELWQCTITNLSDSPKNLSVYPYFSVGYMSWMNQSAYFDTELNGVICSSITPYQKLEDYDKAGVKKDITYLLCQHPVSSWETRQKVFEGEGGLHQPSAVVSAQLANGQCHYQTPIAAVHYKLPLNSLASCSYKFVFGAAANMQEVAQVKERFFNGLEGLTGLDGFEQEFNRYKNYINQAYQGQVISCSEKHFQEFVNNWLPRQVYYHGDVNRLTTDPQTRNYLQDAMGMLYIAPEKTRQALVTVCQQQQADGSLPDGILLTADAELKYINQIPHADHNVWLIITLLAYIDETNDLDLLFSAAIEHKAQLIYQQVNAALANLLSQRDERQLSYIKQGDWCDPMNMVGHKGKGVSTWLSQATIYVIRSWGRFWQQDKGQRSALNLEEAELNAQLGFVEEMLVEAQKMQNAVQQYCWRDNWFARGITDDNVVFGIQEDKEGKIFLNPQSWAMLSDCATSSQTHQMLAAVKENLETPYGVMMLSPAYTQMREDVGRVTQKFPGTAENGSVYNHASVFYAYSLLQKGYADEAFEVLEKMLPTEQDFLIRGQLPLFIPNYYRGAYHQIPEAAGKSSGLFNTGTVAWFLRCIVEEVYGLKGCLQGLIVTPKLPSKWQSASIIRKFRGATFAVAYHRIENNLDEKATSEARTSLYKITIDGEVLAAENGNTWQSTPIINVIEGKAHYQVEVEIKHG